MQLVTNGGLAAASVFLENQASRLDHQAKKRAEAKATATISARRARIARAKAGLDTDASISDLCHSVASASSAKALEVVRAATLASEAAAASVASSAVNCERWIGAHPLSILLAGLTDGDAFPPARRNSGVNIVKRTCAAIMSQVRVLSKEELEEEHHEVRHLRAVCYGKAGRKGEGRGSMIRGSVVFTSVRSSFSRGLSHPIALTVQVWVSKGCSGYTPGTDHLVRVSPQKPLRTICVQ